MPNKRVVAALVVASVVGGITGCSGKAQDPRTVAAASTSAAPSAAATAYTAENFPFIEPDGRTVIGTTAFDKLIAVPYKAPTGAGTLTDVGDAAVRQFFANRELVARGSFDKRYGPIGPETSITSAYYLDVYKTMADPSLTDTSNDGAFVQDFLSVAEGPLRQETVTDAVLTNSVLATTDEQNGNRPTLEFWTRVTETTTGASGRPSSQIRYFNGGMSVENGDWLITGWKEQDASSASGILYGPVPSASVSSGD